MNDGRETILSGTLKLRASDLFTMKHVSFYYGKPEAYALARVCLDLSRWLMDVTKPGFYCRKAGREFTAMRKAEAEVAMEEEYNKRLAQGMGPMEAARTCEMVKEERREWVNQCFANRVIWYREQLAIARAKHDALMDTADSVHTLPDSETDWAVLDDSANDSAEPSSQS